MKVTIAQARNGLQRFPHRVEEFDDAMAMDLQSELDQLLATMTRAIEALKACDAYWHQCDNNVLHFIYYLYFDKPF